ncbi:hypothetical protein V8C42DRAFT_358085 [Trichoderma barbatum]
MAQLQYTYEDYTIGWVCALPNEQAAALFMLDERHEDLDNPSNDQNAYTLGSIGKHKVVIAGLPKGRYGNNSSATVATRMISTFPNIRVGLMVGIGGGIPQKTRLGDVVISCPSGAEPGVVQWDMGKAEQGGQFRRTGSLSPPPTALLTALGKFEADHITSRAKMLSYLDELGKKSNVPRSFLKSSSLNDILFNSKYAHVEGDDCSQCDKNMLVQRTTREDEMIIHCGLIASGNRVIKDAILRDSLFETFDNNVLCVEMEAAGLMNDFPCIVIRGICDYADSHKNEKWQDYAAAVAAACAKAFLTVVPASEVDKLQRVQGGIFSWDRCLPWCKKICDRTLGEKANYLRRIKYTELQDIKKDEIPQASAPEMSSSKATGSDSKVTERTSDENSRETGLDKNASAQTPLELWLREASGSLAKMVQQGEIDAAMKAFVVGLSQLQIPREGMSMPQSSNWKNYPQTPPMSPRHPTRNPGESTGYAQDPRELGSRNASYIPTQPGPTNPAYQRSHTRTADKDNGYAQDPHGHRSRNASYIPEQPGSNYEYGHPQHKVYPSQEEFISPPFQRWQTWPSEDFNNAPVSQLSQYASHGNSVYYTDRGVSPPNYCPKLPPRPPKLQHDPARGGNYGDFHEPGHNAQLNRPRYGSDAGTNSHQVTYADDYAMNTSGPQRYGGYAELPTTSSINQRQPSVDRGRGHPAVNWNNESKSQKRSSGKVFLALFSAIEQGNAATVERLLEDGADIEMIDGSGRTPLWCAVQIGRRDVIQVLLDKGADIDTHNAYGQSILAWAVENHRNEVIDMLGYS